MSLNMKDKPTSKGMSDRVKALVDGTPDIILKTQYKYAIYTLMNIEWFAYAAGSRGNSKEIAKSISEVLEVIRNTNETCGNVATKQGEKNGRDY